jgi:xylulokinase
VQAFGLADLAELEARAARAYATVTADGGGDPRAAAPLFMPFLGDGERDDSTLRAGFVGLSDRHGRDELAYSVLEGLAFGIAETVSVLTTAGSPLSELRVAGGGARLATLGQLKADVLACQVRNLEHDSAPIGVALLAATGAGYSDEADAAVAANLERARIFAPADAAGDVIRERYGWFLEVRASEAVRLRP